MATNKLLLLSLFIGTTLLLLGTSSARSSSRFDRAEAATDTSKARFDFDYGTDWSTVNCTNLTCDKVLDIFWSWLLLSQVNTSNNAQLANYNLNTSAVNYYSYIACQDVLIADPPASFRNQLINHLFF